MITSTEPLWVQGGSSLATQLETASIEVLRIPPFTPGAFRASTLREIKRTGFRIMIFMATYRDNSMAEKVQQEKMTLGFAWLLLDHPERALALQGVLYVQPLVPTEGMQAFADKVSHYSNSTFNITTSADSVDLRHSIALHDAIMLYAHAATKLLTEGGDLRDGQAVTTAIQTTVFNGVGSTVVLDEHGDRIESFEVMNYMEAGSGISSTPIGLYNSTVQQYIVYDWAVVWPGGQTEVPIDYFSGGHHTTFLLSV